MKCFTKYHVHGLWILLVAAVTCFSTHVRALKKCPWDKSVNTSNECFKEIVQEFLEKNRDGEHDREIYLDPFVIPKLEYVIVNKLIAIDLILTNIHFYGYSKTNVTEVINNVNGSTFVIKTHSPLLRYVADYDLSGRVHNKPIYGRGPSKTILENLIVTHRLGLQKFDSDGKTFLKLSNYSIHFSADNFLPLLDNLFDGHPELARETKLQLVNNGNALFAASNSYFTDALGPLIQEKLNSKVFKKIAFEDVFQENPWSSKK